MITLHPRITSKAIIEHIAEFMQCDVASVYDAGEKTFLVYPESFEAPVSVVKTPEIDKPWKSQLLTASFGIYHPVHEGDEVIARARRIADDLAAIGRRMKGGE